MDRYKLTLEIIVAADDDTEAETRIKTIIQEGILAVEDYLPVDSFEIIEIEPAELPD